MEKGLPTKEIFNIVVDYVAKFKHSISHYAGWKVKSITFEDQIFITLMKLRQNYTNLHPAKLFSCSVGTISNIVITFVHGGLGLVVKHGGPLFLLRNESSQIESSKGPPRNFLKRKMTRGK